MSIILKTISPNLTAGNALERVRMRGKPWSIDEERRLRQLVEEGSGIDKISQVMGKTRISVRAKMYNLRLLLVDAAVVQNAVASASVASSPALNADVVPVQDSDGVDVVAAD